MDRDDIDCLPISPTWLNKAESLRASFETAQPFPLLVLDDFLVPELAAGLLSEFPAIDAMPKSRDYVFASKHELSSVEEAGPAGLRFHEAMISPAFANFLRAATGLDVFVDPLFFGGGFHQGGHGSYLDMHVDFNMLVYLNRDWRDEYGGQLLVRMRPTARCVRSNRRTTGQ